MDPCVAVNGEHLNLGKKISVPQDVMMEELTLQSNRGSCMFQERQKRVDRFTVENVAYRPGMLTSQQSDPTQAHHQGAPQAEKENFRTEVFKWQPGRKQLASSLTNTVAKKGNPSVLAPGYSGPLKEIPHEKFNVTVIPKCYRSPWLELCDEPKHRNVISVDLSAPPQKPAQAKYKCFNRAPIPFGGSIGTAQIFPLPGFELLQAKTQPSRTLKSMCDRPNFNRAPRGWPVHYSIESPDL